MIYVIVAGLIGYLLGSINPAILITKYMTQKDIRTMGSSNAGMTNVLRSVGKKAAVGTAIFDLSKGIIAVLTGYYLVSGCTAMDPQYGTYAAGTLAVIGHCFPVFHGFRGGKGVLTITGVVLVIEPWAFLILGLIFLGVFLLTGTISICSLTIAACYPIVYAVLKNVQHQDMLPWLYVAIFLGALIIFQHRSNIQRLLKGEEKKIKAKK